MTAAAGHQPVRPDASQGYDAAEIRAHPATHSPPREPIVVVNARNNSATFKQEPVQVLESRCFTRGQPYGKDVSFRRFGRRWTSPKPSAGGPRHPSGARQVRVRGTQQGAVRPDVRGIGVDRGPVAALPPALHARRAHPGHHTTGPERWFAGEVPIRDRSVRAHVTAAPQELRIQVE